MKTLYIFLMSMLMISIILAQIPNTISYQGVLTDQLGVPKPDGSYTITFSFYESEAGGDAIWNETKTLILVKGLFSTSLGSQTPFGENVKFEKPYWLGIKVGDETELTPRISLSTAGYSFTSAKTLNIVEGVAVKSFNGLKDDVTLEGSGGTTVTTEENKIMISSSGTGGTGLQGLQNTDNTLSITNPNGPSATVNMKLPFKLSGSTTGSNYLYTIDNTGSGHGIIGQVVSGYGVVGIASGTTGQTIGLVGNSFSPAGYAVSGWNLASTGGAVGVIGRTSSKDGIGILGNTASSQGGTGVWGESTVGAGVVGKSTSWVGTYGETSTWFGVWGKATGDNGKGVYGESANSFGVWGVSPNGAGVVGESKKWVGVYGQSDDNAGVWGKSINGYGIYAESVNGFAGYFAGKVAVASLQINGGSDLAEPFEIVEQTGVEPGSVMIIDDENPGKLRLSDNAYDKKVAGIVSGAGGVKPGITLQQAGILEGDVLVAISGKVYCKAEALSVPIKAGDLLTTSNIAGYAMGVKDKELSQGAVIGKAMTELKSGKGLVLVLVNLQ